MRPSFWPLLGALAAAVLAVVTVTVLRPELLPGGSAAPSGHPPLPAGLSPVPLGTPAPAPAGEGGFHVLATDAGQPVRWDPCRPIRYVVDDRAAPPGADYLLTSALAEVQRVTGFSFVREGVTDEVPADDRRPVQPERYGDRWAPVLVVWSDPSAHPRLAGDVAAYAGPQAVDGAEPGTRRYVTGQLVIDSPQLGEAAAGAAGLARSRAVLLHELGHLVGLDHVDDRSQLMFPSTTPLVTDFADGDLRGLAAVSGGPCRTDF
ncbi:matrixin family metalloprotease [Quadrisphaera sp. GCM10027208]|uniref:matrixin family metalloprotease n=1 Tax=Quadrisphaera sp. GCM10027208 TaxID=3273423 RepID=UPI0036085C5B